MPGFIHEIENDQILLDTVVAGFDESDEPSGEFRMCQGLLDTGAQCTGVSPRIVADFGLVPVDIGRMVVANGETEDVFIYQVGVGVAMATEIEVTQGDEPDELRVAGRGESSGKLLRVMGLPQQPDNFDVLLGMDLLSMYHISLADGWLLMSF
jgi:predicted aspartyl protease